MRPNPVKQSLLAGGRAFGTMVSAVLLKTKRSEE
jgi:hypothetical protein